MNSKYILFPNSYILINKKINSGDFVFSKKTEFGFLYLSRNKSPNVYFSHNGSILIGNAFNPFLNIVDEQTLIEMLDSVDNKVDFINHLSGQFTLFVKNCNKKQIFTDPCSTSPVYYSFNENVKIITNRLELFESLFHFDKDLKMEKYLNDKYFNIGIRITPGNQTVFKHVKILTPNILLDYDSETLVRFYPNSNCKKPDFEFIIQLLSKIKSCIEQKYKSFSLSLTGGVDSKMTAALFSNHKGTIKSFTYVTNSQEEKDAIAAKKISNICGFNHSIYYIVSNKNHPDYIQKKDLIIKNMCWNVNAKDDEINKIIFFIEEYDGNPEIKSHISEICRAFYYKKLGTRKIKQPLSARNMSNLTKRYPFWDKNIKTSDKMFDAFIKDTNFHEINKYGYDETDFLYWEHRYPVWGSSSIQMFDLSHETIIIFNNRLLLDALLSFPLTQRIEDCPQKEIINAFCPSLLSDDLFVNNKMESKKRKIIEWLFYHLNIFNNYNK